MRCKGIRFSDVRRELIHNGFTIDSQKGSHVKFVRDGKHLVVTNASSGVNMMVWRRLKKEHGIK